ncbi:GntR family transcriptional regulator [Streptomyces tubbatahanensis]|uniref:GntR family transcriptional regulator n=1 Tax=Streptomyces tubbatahanensis TaxID=2923272 RepID=A0ABY3XUP3_9ACTN|nr:GntR family transcriptional regulator [Streptomyces tubbatahanensis]UNS98073.1 GntR family transcriptional regulator [Streptomyces tubbatahanensis]
MIRRSTLRSQIAAALRDEILAGRLATGRDFTVKEIAEQYGVSATPVREALVDLAAQGLLDVEQHRGFRVHEFTLADYRAMCEARQLVVDGLFHRAPTAQPPPGPRPGDTDAGAETDADADPDDGADADSDADADADSDDGAEAGSDDGADAGPASPEAGATGGRPVTAGRPATAGSAAARRALGGLRPEVLASVRRRADAAERAARAGDLDVLIAYDLRFWRELSGLLGNPYVCDFLERLRVQCWVFAVPVLRAQATLRGRLWSGHNALLDAVERGDARAARDVLATYNQHALAQVGVTDAEEPA